MCLSLLLEVRERGQSAWDLYLACVASVNRTYRGDVHRMRKIIMTDEK